MSRLRTQSPDSPPPGASMPDQPPADIGSGAPAPDTPSPLSPAHRVPAAGSAPTVASKRTTWLLVAGWIGVMAIIYVATDMYRKPAEGKVLAHGVLEIPRDRDGHFRVQGSINGVPVQFMVDTGASIISITDKTSERAQLPEGVPMMFQTANGTREGTMRRAERVEVGPFTVNNLRVGTGYTGESERDALLGQNFLRYFDVTMERDVMRLKARDQAE